MIDLSTVNIDNNNVSFTLNWDEPFDNFDPIVNYTITINCTDASCPVMFIVTTTSASVSFITDLSMMTPLSVTASNTVGTSDPTTISIAGESYVRAYLYELRTYTYTVSSAVYMHICTYVYGKYSTFIADKL